MNEYIETLNTLKSLKEKYNRIFHEFLQEYISLKKEYIVLGISWEVNKDNMVIIYFKVSKEGWGHLLFPLAIFEEDFREKKKKEKINITFDRFFNDSEIPEERYRYFFTD